MVERIHSRRGHMGEQEKLREYRGLIMRI